MKQEQYFPIHQKIEERRLELGLSDIKVAEQIRLSICEYGDIESYADEIFTVTPLYYIKKLCSTLKIDFFSLFGMPCVFCDKGEIYLNDYSLNRNLLVHKRREELGLLIEQLGDKVGFFELEIYLIETYAAHLESWVIENIFNLANQLNIPYQILLDVQCKKCNR